ncbi:CHAP domain-containing protein [Roseomonas sp. OT10]|uniref:CHAP domain-containing protein n=1 Tax=Roseomonas cutis TaxID=2897332 RepID=UPI001E47EF13|nr:CHAP domain-containing protein [Roseomonas sp. OT10]UFN50341.1 CHAP domain-containing protein [Roseomonas sp. OT10]
MAVLLGGLLLPAGGAEAAQQRQASKQSRPAAAHVSTQRGPRVAINRQASRSRQNGQAAMRSALYSGSISCVPYARMVTGMDISGNGWAWWGNAAGRYERGQRPEPGSVLAFRASGGMRSGHVAVVERIVNSREITVQHSNWEGPGIRKGTPMRGVSVVDVSANNDWTAVRVQVGRSDDTYGRAYPTYGFIHNRPTGGATLRYTSTQPSAPRYQEVAEAPAIPRSLDLTVRNLDR